MRFFLLPLLLIAGIGLTLCTAIHIASYTGHLTMLSEALDEETLTTVAMCLAGGLFSVWIPAVLIAQRINNGNRLNFSWKKVLVGCPPWMAYTGYALFGYAILNFLLIISINSGELESFQGVRVFSGHAMMFYGLAFAIFYSSWNRPHILRSLQCPAGHDVAHEDKFCPLCGLPTAQTGKQEW